jgi:acetyl esterase/lipase
MVAAIVAMLLGAGASYAQPMTPGPCASGAQPGFLSVPDTISPEWQARLRGLSDPSCQPALPGPDDLDGWCAIQQARETGRMPQADAAIARLQPTFTPAELGGVPVLDIKPKDWQDNGKVLVYMHGGGFVFWSALGSSAVVADASGLRVISIDYTLAPVGKWDRDTDEVVAVVQALVSQGYRLQDIVMYGDSAGGSLAASSILKMRDRGLGMPAAVVLWSPGVDLSDRGDTMATLVRADPTVLYENSARNGNAAYADPSEWQNPYVSPVYGDFSGGFPPTLIQGGTKEVLLSGFVRLYQALDRAGVPVTLDLYEGMPHVFQQVLPESLESRIAVDKTAKFLNTHLGH